MYCNTCGHLNGKHDMYCSNDGTLLRKQDMKMDIHPNGGVFCSSCGTKTSNEDLYCSSCGQSLVTTKVQTRGGLSDISWTKTTEINVPAARKLLSFPLDIKNSLISTAIALGVVVIFALVLMLGAKSIMNNLMSEGMQGMELSDMMSELEYNTDTDLPKLDSIVGFTDFVMAEHLQIPKIVAKVQGSSILDVGHFNGSVKIGIGMLIYIIGPFLGLFIAGLYIGRQKVTKTITEKLYQALSIGICYAIILSIFSLFSGFSKKMSISEDGLHMSFHLGVNYSFFGVLITSLLFGVFFSFLGILFSVNFKRTTGNLREISTYGQAFHQGFAVFYRGFGLCALVCIIGLSIWGAKYNVFDYLEQHIDFLTVSKMKVFYYLTLGLQFGLYIWSLLHIAPLSFGTNIGGDNGTLTYQIFSGFKGTGAADQDYWMLENALSTHNIDLYLKLAIIIPIALFLYAGFRMAKSASFSWKSIVLFALVYSLFMSIAAGYTNMEMGLSFSGTGLPSKSQFLFFGFHPFGMFIRSFLFSFLISYGGAFLRKIIKNN
ncbi:zinc ribbon domain-containing protein [Bacillus sp. FJAT-49736]|uniref:zinc ribbon domain-containing protein n=1 Tax=Bacillus sp. FJAT-49736 TaxID=2833582 RepID=UPI001BC9594F|nr:zinc ribbon domain-containing protein [Bacillus sp. FJAT-49736]MBS4174248.1 zinc ribbon domain-containing protein [Bacillus sp. FJAT-49736]